MNDRIEAFLSYAREDKTLAARISRRVRRYAPPRGAGLGKRQVSMIRDEERFTAAESLTALLQKSAGAVDKFVLLCSPDAKSSPYVNQEIEAFVKAKGSESVICVLCRGELATALPPAYGATNPEPLYIDMRSLSRKEFRDSSLRLIASLYGVDFNELWREDDAHRRRVRTAWAVTLIGSVILLASAYLIASTSPDAWERIAQPDSREQYEWREGPYPVHDIAISKSDPSVILYYGRNSQWTDGPLPPTFSVQPDSLNYKDFEADVATRLKGMPPSDGPLLVSTVEFKIDQDQNRIGHGTAKIHAAVADSNKVRFTRTISAARIVSEDTQVELPGMPTLLASGDNPFDLGGVLDAIIAASPKLERSSDFEIEGTIRDELTGKEIETEFGITDEIDPYDTWQEYLDDEYKVFGGADPNIVQIGDQCLAKIQHDPQTWPQIVASSDWVKADSNRHTNLGQVYDHEVDSDRAADAFLKMALKVPNVGDGQDLAKLLADIWPGDFYTSLDHQTAEAAIGNAELIGMDGLQDRQGDGFHPAGNRAWAVRIGESPWRQLKLPSDELLGIWSLGGDDALVLTADQGFFRTRDAGLSWSDANYNETGFTAGQRVKVFVVNGADTTFALIDRGSAAEDPENPLFRLRRLNWLDRWRTGLVRILEGGQAIN